MSAETPPPAPQHIDLQQMYTVEVFRRAPVYVFGEIVQAHPADWLCIAFERTVHDGRVETGFIATRPGDQQIISGQEIRVVPREEFKGYYQLPDGRYMIARHLVRAVQNPFGVPVTTVRDMGEEMTGGPDCMIAVKTPADPREPLRQIAFIEPDQFETICRPYEEVFGRPFGQRPVREWIAIHARTVRGLRWLADRILPEWQQT